MKEGIPEVMNDESLWLYFWEQACRGLPVPPPTKLQDWARAKADVELAEFRRRFPSVKESPIQDIEWRIADRDRLIDSLTPPVVMPQTITPPVNTSFTTF